MNNDAISEIEDCPEAWPPKDKTQHSPAAEQVMRLSSASLVVLWPGVKSMSDLDIEVQNFVNWCYEHPTIADWGEALMEYRHGNGS